MASGSKIAVGAAIIGNFLVMIAKFLAWRSTGSGAMLSETIHSLADVLNQSLIMLGLWLGQRSPDPNHPYGYLGDRFIWALISAVGIFFLGCGVTGYHGIHSLMHLKPLTPSIWAYVVLIVSLIIEGSVFMIAIRAFLKDAGDRPKLKFLFNEADPPQVAVILEDGVAVLGILFALGAIGLSNLLGQPIWDAIGTLLIALLLGAVALLLVAQNRRLLIGTAVPPAVREGLLEIVNKEPIVGAVYDFKSRMLSVDKYRVKMEVEFEGEEIAKKLKDLIHKAYPKINSLEKFEAFCEEFAGEVIDALGDEIDRIEKEIQAKYPKIKHVDIETD